MKRLQFIIFLILIGFQSFSQVPDLFKYQALIRDNEGSILSQETVNIRTSIISGNFDGVTVYSETHLCITNPFGLVNLNIGGGLVEFGNFGSIDWGSSTHFLKLEVDRNGGENFEYLGISQLLSVPYALFAKRTGEINKDNDPENELQNLTYSNGNLTISKGNSVFIDINDGDSDATNEIITRVSLQGSVLEIEEGNELKTIDLANLAAIQSLSFDRENKILYLENGGSVNLSLLYNDSDSVSTNELISNFILDGTSLKITEGGVLKTVDLAILADNQSLIYDPENKILKIDGGNQVNLSDLINDADANPTNELQTLSFSGSTLTISNGNTVNIESSLAFSDADGDTKIVVEENENDNILRFYSNGIELFRVGKEAVIEFLTTNTRVGNSAGKLITTGNLNTLLGYMSGNKLTTGSSNTLIGSNSGENSATSSFNTFVGSNSGKFNTTGNNNFFGASNSGFSNINGQYNTFLGSESGFLNTSGSNNVFIGYKSGNENIVASGNTFSGSYSGAKNTGIYNSFFGFEAGFNTLGNYNTFVGTKSGYSNKNSAQNTFLGYNSGYFNTIGSENVFIGNESGFSNTTSSGNVFLGASSGYSNENGLFNTYLGYSSGKMNTSSSNTYVGYESGLLNLGSENVFVGKQVSTVNSQASHNVYVGNYVAKSNLGNENVSIGLNSASLAQDASQNTFLGFASGFSTLGNSNVFIGYKSGYNELNSNKLYIENSDSDLPLIYGEFDNDLIQFNAKVGINTLPSEALTVNGAIKISNTLSQNVGTIRFNGTNFQGFDGTSWLRLDLQQVSNMSDADATTGIFAEQTTNDNQLRFFTNNTERLIITENGTIDLKGTNFFIGEQSGLKNTLGNENIYLGYLSGSENTEGNRNLAMGHFAGSSLVLGNENIFLGNLSAYNQYEGNKNTFLGFASGYSSISGSSNVFIGYEAGYFETESNKLYIQNSKINTPLIYGDFDTHELIFDANVSIGNTLAVEKLDVDGAIKLANTFLQNEGTIRWTGLNFEGYTGSEWKVLDHQYFDKIRTASNSTSFAISNSSGTYFNYIIDNELFLKISKSKLELFGNDIFIGEEAGKMKTSADKNIFIGYKSGSSTQSGSNNVFLGYQSGILNSSGSDNVFLGFRSGNKNTLGKQNTFLGFQSGHDNSAGEDNVFLGYNSGYFSILNNQNVFVGSYSGYQNQSSHNVFIGMNSGRNNLSGSGNVFVGNNAGMNEVGSNKLYISNSETAEPLIAGDFASKELTVNNKLNVKEVLHLTPLSSAPSNPKVGDLYMGTDDKLYIFVSTNGGEWKAVAFQ